MLHILSTVVVLLIAGGLWVRHRQPRVHLRLMMAAFCCDMGLLVYIEATRHAVETVATRGTPLIWFHAAISSLVVLAYIAQIALGRRMLLGLAAPRRVHAVLGITFAALRSLNYITSFMV
jgi:uncharacterized membrane protein YozB (DUF420 family)